MSLLFYWIFFQHISWITGLIIGMTLINFMVNFYAAWYTPDKSDNIYKRFVILTTEQKLGKASLH